MLFLKKISMQITTKLNEMHDSFIIIFTSYVFKFIFFHLYKKIKDYNVDILF
jgi:hypothetical protein